MYPIVYDAFLLPFPVVVAGFLPSTAVYQIQSFGTAKIDGILAESDSFSPVGPSLAKPQI